MKITNWALSHKTSVFVFLWIAIIGGLVAYSNLPVESFPQIKQPVVVVAAPYLGVAPSDMETLVAQPIENKLDELAKVKKMTSVSLEGYTNIVVEFEPDVDIDEAVRKVREKVDQAKPDLPADLDDPVIQEINFENIPIMFVSIVGDQSLVRLKKIAEDLQDRFEQIPGVLDVKISGGLEREVQVEVNPARLQYYNVGLTTVIDAIRGENITIPGGSLETGSLKWTLRIPGEFESLNELENLVVKTRRGQPIYLKDLADIRFGFKEQESFSRLDGKPSVTLSIQKRSGENIIQISDAVKRILEDYRDKLPRGTHFVILGDQSKDIRRMVNDLENNIIAGLLLVILVLYFFMGTRNGFLVGIAIPLSMLLSFIVISLLGYTLNMVVLFSLILALGMLVDNAIVIVENIYRHHEEGKSLLRAAREATAEVGMPVIASTATTLLAFLPMVFWPGIVGEFMSYLPITLIITLSASLFVALVFNPVISSSFLKLDERMSQLPGDRLLRWLTVHYERTLRWSLHNPRKMLGMVAGAYVGMFILFIFFNHGIEFFPDLEPKQAIIKVEAPLGTRLETSDAIVRQIERRIVDTPDMKHYVAEIGNASDNRFDFGMSGGAPHKSKITIDFLERHLRSQNTKVTLEQLREKVRGIPGARIDVTKPQEGPPTGKAVEIRIQGEDFGVLESLADQVKRLIGDVPGLTELKDDHEQGRPELRVRIDREKAALMGLNTRKIASTVRTAIQGSEASEYRIGQDEYDITVRFSKDFRKNYEDLLNLTIFYEGKHYPLANFATIELASGLSSVNHVDGDRVITVTADAVGRRSAEVLRDVKERLKDFHLPPGYSLSYGGQDVEQREAEAFITRAFFIAIMLIFLVLATEFNSVTLPLVIMMSVLLSFFGVFFGLLVTFKPFGIIMTGIGIVSLAGVVVNNAIVLIDYIQQLRDRGMDKLEAIVQGGKVRLRPVILTAVTTILGLIPLTVGINIDFIGLFKGDFSKFIQFGVESSQWWSGMGVAVIFGLFFSTALTLVVVPVMYSLLADAVPELMARLGWRTAGKDDAQAAPEGA
ncbi:MAG: efflux RND transporter permease subunit [Calditrichaeota bacterium]|nr:MAG: efflux RND transporter permease subunit [Calditrichota bacterium]